ncbi:MAG: peptidylprolyl isomerase [bacterium]|nr:peptidylprolyl isomerase [bacterium]
MVRPGYRAVFLVVAFVLLHVTACQEEPSGTVVATVGESHLTQQDIEMNLPVQMIGRVTVQDQRRIAEGWVEEELFYQEAVHKKLDQDPAVQSRVSRARRDMLIAELLTREFEQISDVTGGEIQGYYDSHQADFVRDKPEIRVRHILVEGASELDQVRKRLRSGDLFDQVAREMSIDASAESGGDLGYFTEDMVVPVFWDACEKAKVGRQAVVVTRLGRHLVEVLDRREAGSIKGLPDVQVEIRQRILAERRQARRLELLVELRNRNSWSIIPGEAEGNEQESISDEE